MNRFIKSSHADRLTSHFDKDWTMNRSSLRAKTADDRSYDPSHSWDARTDDPVEFSRLQTTEMPLQSIRPITLSGAAVVALETQTDGLRVLNGYQPPKVLAPIPLTVEQQDVGMKIDLSCKVEMDEKAKSNNKVVLQDANPSFQFFGNRGPKFREDDIPNYLIEAGPQCDQRLLNPKQRRAISEFEKKKFAADLNIKEAQMSRGKTRKQVSGLMFHRGILAVDSATNTTSEIYGSKAQTYSDGQSKKSTFIDRRRERLGEMRSSMEYQGNILNPASVHDKPIRKSYQSKAREHTQFTVEESHERLFPPRAEKKLNVTRIQYLRDQDLSGKNFNIVSHTKIEHWPSNCDERTNKRLTHPSQTSFSEVVNRQGSLRTEFLKAH